MAQDTVGNEMFRPSCEPQRTTGDNSINLRLADEQIIERLRGQLQNCVELLHRFKRHGSAKDVEAVEKAIYSANRVLYETLMR